MKSLSLPEKSLMKNLVIFSAIVFGVVSVYFFYIQKVYLSLIPLAVIPMYWIVTKPRILWYFLVFLTPLSLSFEETALGGVGLTVPTEPLLLVLLVLVAMQSCFSRIVPIQLWRHPIAIALVVYLLWICVAACASSMPIVSFKYLLARLWFVVPIFFMGVGVLVSGDLYTNCRNFIKLYVLAFLVVAVYTLAHHATYGFADKPAHWVMQPFVKDHTLLGAMYGLVIPVSIFLAFSSRSVKGSLFWVLGIAVFVVGLYFTYCRAALVGVVVIGGVYLADLLGCRLKHLMAMGVGVMLIGILAYPTLLQELERNRVDSSESFAENVSSIANISTDASNLERLNRWACAWEMGMERPLFGWGPGVYKFLYAPFQRSEMMTIISTNVGDVGNAHSEYLGALAESGWLGMMSVLALFGMITYRGLRLYEKMDKGDPGRNLILACTLGLITYFVHSFLNNFLDTDKVSVLVWGFSAILVAYDGRRLGWWLGKEEES